MLSTHSSSASHCARLTHGITIRAGFSDVEEVRKLLELAYQSLSKLRESISSLSVAITSGRNAGAKK